LVIPQSRFQFFSGNEINLGSLLWANRRRGWIRGPAGYPTARHYDTDQEEHADACTILFEVHEKTSECITVNWETGV
jgi:hypothetical protein